MTDPAASRRFICRACKEIHYIWAARCSSCHSLGGLALHTGASAAMPTLVDPEEEDLPSLGEISPRRLQRPDDLATRRQAIAAKSDLDRSCSVVIDLTDDRDDILRISEVSAADHDRRLTLIEPLDRVLGGGLVVGGSILVSGGPGAGKSTLLSQMIASVCRPDRSPCEVVLWASAEETPAHIKLRAERIGVAGSSIEVYAQKRDVDRIIAHAKKMRVEVLVVDSIQTIVTHDLDSLAGSQLQCMECARRLDQFGKETGTSVVIISQINKSGQTAGPNALQHLVDATFSIEKSTEFENIRYLRAEKNRFGSVTEVGAFEMLNNGMIPADEKELAMRDPDRDAMLPIAQELLQQFLELGGVLDDGLRDRIAGRLDLTPRGSAR
jgi:predicted ATP-dependent serine protease